MNRDSAIKIGIKNVLDPHSFSNGIHHFLVAVFS